ncbi:ADP/ATP-dependent (S)-NAD(P)H-hydrate dehydratase [Herbiconiux sp.]|uniref:ADP-dependent NAD(P)H-hydrate dehydratase n=1 Tax=Herbiconiux sp. TaxID=1871186 RepID=UPI0025B8291C|nr:ADP/ATP-dependent (S)-NAD(P)H-hydrate dehydratase [Herbiconiux sp.]
MASDEGSAVSWREWNEVEASAWVRAPRSDDDKYTRGVLGVITGSASYPGAAVLGVEAAVRAGAGMVRYLGDQRPSGLVLSARPEAVTKPGRVQAWLIGSGTDAAERDDAARERIEHALGDGVPLVLDAGALDLAPRAPATTVLTPHAGELTTLLAAFGVQTDRAGVRADPASSAQHAADLTGCVVLLKGRITHVVAPRSLAAPDDVPRAVRVEAPTSWAATAGSGDVLGGIVGALVAAQSEAVLEEPARLVAIAATGAWVHARAAELAADGGPVPALEIAGAAPRIIARLLG